MLLNTPRSRNKKPKGVMMNEKAPEGGVKALSESKVTVTNPTYHNNLMSLKNILRTELVRKEKTQSMLIPSSVTPTGTSTKSASLTSSTA